jgi:hypothetical protein
MASTEHPGHSYTVPPEVALLGLVAAFAIGLALAWPWW